jgi:hypothetical protein
MIMGYLRVTGVIKNAPCTVLHVADDAVLWQQQMEKVPCCSLLWRFWKNPNPNTSNVGGPHSSHSVEQTNPSRSSAPRFESSIANPRDPSSLMGKEDP